MTTGTWFRAHEGWFGALLLSIGAFSLGMVTSSMLESRSCTNQITALTQGFNLLIGQKDIVITKLSTSNTTATTAAVQATNTAVRAVDTAVKATQEDAARESVHK
jgi:hypothetical protein